MQYSGKTTEHCNPAIMEKIKKDNKQLAKKKENTMLTKTS